MGPFHVNSINHAACREEPGRLSLPIHVYCSVKSCISLYYLRPHVTVVLDAIGGMPCSRADVGYSLLLSGEAWQKSFESK